MNDKRVIIVDSLRGFALLLIVLIHYVEHFDFFFEPQKNLIFSIETDRSLMDWVFFIISGKAYSIFALLFGFSFYIQMKRQEQKGVDFRLRFVWRLTVLLILGFIHSLVYKGDILHIYAILGLFLVPLYKVNIKTLWWIAVLLFLQIPLIYHLIRSFINPAYEYAQSFGSAYWDEGNKTYATGSFWDVLSYNFWKGRTTTLGWTYYNGRYLQLPALFIIGFILGKKKIFEEISKYTQFLIKMLVVSVFVLIGFNIILALVPKFQFTDLQNNLLETILKSYANLAFTSILVSGIILVYLRFQQGFVFKLFAAYGKMSLSNYVFQAVFGVVFFYGFGLGMYRYMGSTLSILFGAIVFITQAFICKYWATKFYYGPLEWFWRAATFLDFGIKFRKKQEEIPMDAIKS